MTPKPITARAENNEIQTTVDDFPEKCPLCNHAIDPKFVVAYLLKDSGNLEIAFRCPRTKCGHLFIGYYIENIISIPGAPKYFLPIRGPNTAHYCLSSAKPSKHKSSNFSDEIGSISSNFPKIYDQASEAEEIGLYLICGGGYRKAFEFLIKDYSIQKNPEKEEQIKKDSLGDVIVNFVDDPRLKEMSKRAVWLGNDEIHYIRKWEGQDLADLKKIIELAIRWIESEKMTEEYIQEMPTTKTKDV